MADKVVPYLTVAETAERLRVTPQTVYRWCRSGRLAATKIGKAWRIPVDQLGRGPRPSGLISLDTLLAGLIGRSEHLLCFASDSLALASLEATFIDVAAANGGRLVYGRWEEGTAKVRQRLRPVIKSSSAGEGALNFLDVGRTYEEQGVDGVLRLLLKEAERAGADGKPCCAYGACYLYFGYHFTRQSAFECALNEGLRGQPLLLLCGLSLRALSELYQGRMLSLMTELMSYHTGVIWFDGERALLQRPAG